MGQSIQSVTYQNPSACWVIFHADFFQNLIFSKNSFRIIIRVSNCLDSPLVRLHLPVPQAAGQVKILMASNTNKFFHNNS